MNLLSCLERASLFGVAALLVALFLQWVLANRVPASWRVWLWRVALIQTALSLVPLAPIALSILPTRAPIPAPRQLEAPALQSAPATAPVVPAPDAATATDAAPVAPSELAPPVMAPAPEVQSAPVAPAPRRAFDWRGLLVAVYLSGVAVQLALLARNALRVRRILSVCTPLDGALLAPLASRLKIKNVPRLLQSPGGAPFLVGLGRPTIVLPVTLERAHQEAVLAHELAHHRRRDLAWNTLLWALQTLLWFHPLSWVARRFHALEIESACDALTLQWTPIAPKTYGALLIGTQTTPTSPLTAGVNDGFFALQTRLQRLNRAPQQPRRGATWLLSGALLLSFAAVLPFELRARAQTKAKPATETQSLRGTVRDFNGQSVAGATVYIMEPMDDGGDPRAQTRSDAQGKFALANLKIDQYGVVVFVDAGRRGIAEKQFDLNSSDDAGNFAIKLPQPSVVNLLMSDESGRRIKGVEVRLGRVGTSFNSWMAMPRAVKARYRATTSAVGIAVFPPLPMGMLAQFQLTDQVSKPTNFGLGDLRGGKYAPLAAEDAVRLNRTGVMHSIILVPPTRLEGRVTLEDGQPKGNVLILAHRVNAAQKAGDNQNREPFIAQTRSNSQGQYVMDGLRPGNYYVWVYPEKQLAKDYIGPSYQRDLTQKTNRVDFQLSRGAIIQGVVVSQITKMPVKGQTMWLLDAQGNNQYVITDARGYFKFRAPGGKQRLRIHANGTNSPPGFRLPADPETNFTIKNGAKIQFEFELPGRSLDKKDAPVSGVVVGPDGQAVANATVVYRVVSAAMTELRTIQADNNGRFTVMPPPYSFDKPLQLWADAGELTTPHAVVATHGQKVSLRLAREGWASIVGQIVDQNQKPLAGAKITQMVLLDNNGSNTRQTRSDAQGRFAFERVRPGAGSRIYSDKAGYTNGNWRQESVAPGQRITANVVVQRASKTLSGVVIDEAGRPSKSYQVWATGQRETVLTRGDGKFYSAQVVEGPLWITVYAPRDSKSWTGFRAQGGDKNIVIRLSEERRLVRSSPRKGAEKIDPVTLVGQPAPPIRAVRWSNGRALPLSGLRGQTVLLAFDLFGIAGMGGHTTLRDIARSQKERFQTIGVQLQMEKLKEQQSADQVARSLGIPIAVDAAIASRKATGWQTFAAYGHASYAVIGRDGKVVYAGDKLDRAIELATAK